MEEISINRPFLSLSAERWISLGCGAGNCGCLNRADMVSFARTRPTCTAATSPGSRVVGMPRAFNGAAMPACEVMPVACIS